MKQLFYMILRRQPHLIALNGLDIDATRLAKDVQMMIKSRYDDGEIPFEIPVEITNSDAARVYMNSRMAMVQFFGQIQKYIYEFLARILRISTSST
jgi:hypothetical protein